MKYPNTSLLRSHSASLMLLALTWGAGSLSANLLVHEPFEYERRQGHAGVDIPGEGVQGLNGGVGFSGAWTSYGSLNAGIPEGEGDYGDGATYGITLGARTAPLSYTDSSNNSLVTTGNQMRTAFGNNSWDRRSLAAPIGDPGSTVWVSFLAQAHGISGSSPRYAFLELSSDGNQRLWIGKVTPVTNGNWGINLPDNSSGGPISADFGDSALVNEPTMILMKLEFSDVWGPTQISVWLNPPDLNDEEALPEPVFADLVNYTTYNQIGIAGRYSTDFDEIRIATSFETATPSEVLSEVEPNLAVSRDGDNVVVSWAVAASNYTLHFSDNLTTWTEVTDEPVIEGDQHEVTLPIEGDRQFYRLQQPTL